jgi:Ca2+-transporting ATPase
MARNIIVISKGAVESITSILDSPDGNTRILREASELAANGIRVLAYGYKVLEKIPRPFSYPEIEKGLSFAGLTGMIDPPREEVKTAIKECKMAGIQPVMITGDHPETAAAIAKEIGILDSNGLMVTGQELNSFIRRRAGYEGGKSESVCKTFTRAKIKYCKVASTKKTFCGDDRRWCKRCALSKGCQHRDSNGNIRNRCNKRSSTHDIAR